MLLGSVYCPFPLDTNTGQQNPGGGTGGNGPGGTPTSTPNQSENSPPNESEPENSPKPQEELPCLIGGNASEDYGFVPTMAPGPMGQRVPRGGNRNIAPPRNMALERFRPRIPQPPSTLRGELPESIQDQLYWAEIVERAIDDIKTHLEAQKQYGDFDSASKLIDELMKAQEIRRRREQALRLLRCPKPAGA